jgi:hypothetical protein
MEIFLFPLANWTAGLGLKQFGNKMMTLCVIRAELEHFGNYRERKWFALKFYKGDKIKGLVIRSSNTKKLGKLNRSKSTGNIH